jgi:hypothetical protein
MRGAATACGILLAACTSVRHDHGFDQRDRAARAFRSFQAAVAEEDHDREFVFLSDGLRRRFGVRSRTEWKDARAAVLTQSHRAIRGILRARIAGRPEIEPDGRARLDIRVRVLFFTVRGQVWLRPSPILRVTVAGETRPRVYLDLPGIGVLVVENAVAVPVPPGWKESLEEELDGARITSVQAQVEWFVDDFVVGEASAAAAGGEVEQKRK